MPVEPTNFVPRYRGPRRGQHKRALSWCSNLWKNVPVAKHFKSFSMPSVVKWTWRVEKVNWLGEADRVLESSRGRALVAEWFSMERSLQVLHKQLWKSAIFGRSQWHSLWLRAQGCLKQLPVGWQLPGGNRAAYRCRPICLSKSAPTLV